MIDYVKQYKGSINQMPKEYRHLVVKKFLEQGGKLAEFDEFILDVDIYVEIDLKNFWKKVDKPK